MTAKKTKKTVRSTKCAESSGNVFADIGLPNPEEALAKAEIVFKISEIIKKKKLTQAKVAKILKMSQPKVSLLLRGYLLNFSLERLLRFLNDLGQDVCICITPSSRSKQGTTRIGVIPSKARIAALGK